MTKHLKNFLRGIGSVLDIAPSPTLFRHIPKGGDCERLQGDLQRVGRDMFHVVERTSNERRIKRSA